jgi:hypothetical protein
MPVILATWEAEIGRTMVQGQSRKQKSHLISKIPTQKRASGVAQASLPSKHEALSSNPSAKKKKEEAELWWLTPVILACQETCGLKSARQIVHETLSRKIPSLKKGLWSGSKCSSNLSTTKKKKKKEKKRKKKKSTNKVMF